MAFFSKKKGRRPEKIRNEEVKVEPLSEYLKNPNKKVIDIQLLFDFILDMNVQEHLRT